MVAETLEQEQRRKEAEQKAAAGINGPFALAASPSQGQQPLGFDQLNPMQQGIAMLFFFLAMLLDPEKLKGMGLDNVFGSILGLDPNKGESFAKWQNSARERNETPDSLARHQDYNKFDFRKADELRRSNVPMADLIRKDGPALLHPDLVARMEKDPKIKDYVQYTLEAAKKNGIDGTLLANQFWQESRFNPRAGSGAGAKGIAQFIDSTGAQYGLRGGDLYDPYKSIDAGARHMKDLTQKFGSQELALAAYNGGGGSVNYVQKSLGKKDISVGDWMGFMADQRARLGVGSSNLWRNQTYDYITKISPAYWSDSQRARAQVAMEKAGLGSKTPEQVATVPAADTSTRVAANTPAKPGAAHQADGKPEEARRTVTASGDLIPNTWGTLRDKAILAFAAVVKPAPSMPESEIKVSAAVAGGTPKTSDDKPEVKTVAKAPEDVKAAPATALAPA